MCNIVQTIRTGKTTVNLAAVTGAVATGIGYSQLTELLAAINIPNMSNKTYIKYHAKLSSVIDAELEKEAAIAGKEEAQLAIECGDVSATGIPIISVIVDGAWSKRSYRTNYNALSGVACIIGAKTKKILYVGIKNKYCFVCQRGSNKHHRCFKNWNSTSTGMEAAIIVEGFKKSLQTHNLIYGKMIGDGDSSVYKKLVEVAPYGPTFLIKKIECRNHLLRNYINKLSDLTKDTKYPVALRKKLSNRDVLGRFRNAVTKAVEYRNKCVDQSYVAKYELLKSDILNGPKHIFGDHSSCDDYYCRGVKQGEENLVPQLVSSKLLDAIMVLNMRLINNITSLMYDVDTNSAETFNSVVAKFVGGKRVNFSLKNSYETRCKAAAISYNSKGEFLIRIHQAVYGTDLDYYMELYNHHKKKVLGRIAKRKTRKVFASTDDEYGPEAGIISDMGPDLYHNASQEFLRELGSIDRNELMVNTVLQSNSDLWITERKKRITASNFGKICKLRKTTSTAKTIMSLLYNNFKGSSATNFGLQSEDVAIKLFEKQYSKCVKKTGLIVDEQLPFLACSPDGFIGTTALIEIKSSEKSENLHPIEAVIQNKIDYCHHHNGQITLKRSHSYYYQIQGLLHITRRDVCYFAVFTKGGLHVEEIQRDDNFWAQKMEMKLTEFYMRSLLPELVDSRRSKNQNIRDVYMNC
ncbi:hypothetical protein RI129_006376 [Pyrocoelia pectoralis]|uniref:YqaJ viral recombinase domain-containing protein n=1 Tax=Pyrocoelia pectoralis TaxID=417401 RepID=A0AAN7VH42_9COLE